MKKYLSLLFVFLFAIMIASCDKKMVFEKYKAIPPAGWHKDSLIIFNIPVFDTLQNHNLYIDIRNETTYKYSNLWLFIEIMQPNGKTMKDTFELVLAEPSGEWLGSGIGAIKTRQSILRRGVYFPVPGEYTVKIQQGMREDVLKGIHDVGFRVEKVN